MPAACEVCALRATKAHPIQDIDPAYHTLGHLEAQRDHYRRLVVSLAQELADAAPEAIGRVVLRLQMAADGARDFARAAREKQGTLDGPGGLEPTIGR